MARTSGYQDFAVLHFAHNKGHRPDGSILGATIRSEGTAPLIQQSHRVILADAPANIFSAMRAS
jgi:hypothetical protein